MHQEDVAARCAEGRAEAAGAGVTSWAHPTPRSCPGVWWRMVVCKDKLLSAELPRSITKGGFQHEKVHNGVGFRKEKAPLVGKIVWALYLSDI